MSLIQAYALLALATLTVLALERLWPGSRAQRGEWATNGAAFLLYAVGAVLLSPAILIGEQGLVQAAGGGLVDLTALPLWAGFAIYLVAMDLGEYLFHRAQHAFPWLWAMHSLHHSDTAMNATTAQRHFWLEPAIKTTTIWLAVALVFKAGPAIVGLYSLATLWHVFSHANVAFGFGPGSFLLNSPQYHRRHHSTEPAHFNSNFAALLPIFDVLTGAYRPPRGSEFPPTGLADDSVRRPVELMLWPLRRLMRRCAAAA